MTSPTPPQAKEQSTPSAGDIAEVHFVLSEHAIAYGVLAKLSAICELAAATERLNAPVAEIESQVFRTEATYWHEARDVVPADVARDLGRRLAESIGRIARLEAELTETSDTLDHL